MHSVIDKILYVGVTLEEPEQFVDYTLEEHLLRRQKGKSLAEVEAYLTPEYGTRAHSRAVGFDDSVLANVSQKVQILSHFVENAKIIASSKVSPGRRTVEGYSGLFGESGRC